MNQNYGNPVNLIRLYISDHIDRIDVIDEFLTLRNNLIIESSEVNVSETELFNDMLENKQIAQLCLNLYKNYDHVHTNVVQVNNQSKQLQSFLEKHKTLSQGSGRSSLSKPTLDSLTKYITKYLLDYIALERLEDEKTDVRSLMRSICFYCDSDLDGGGCQICCTSTLDMRKYARRHYQTLRKASRGTKKTGITSHTQTILKSVTSEESENSVSSTNKKIKDCDALSLPTFHTWSCQQCSFNNAMEHNNCVVCFSSHGVPRRKSSNVEGVVARKFQSDGACEYKGNESVVRKCNNAKKSVFKGVMDSLPKMMQHNFRPKKPNNPEWSCWNPKCESVNKEIEKFCAKCGIQRKFSKEFIQRDNGRQVMKWMCDKCYKVNERSNRICQQCNTCNKFGSSKFYEPAN